MAYQLRCTVRGDGASGAYLDREHAEAALGSSELLRIASYEDAPHLGAVEFPRRDGMRRGMVMERWYQVQTAGPLVNRLVAEYLEAVLG